MDYILEIIQKKLEILNYFKKNIIYLEKNEKNDIIASITKCENLLFFHN